MSIYFPVAEMSGSIFFIMCIGGVAGFLSNIFGIGGGFIATPLLITIGVPAHVATACATQQIIGSSLIGVLTKLKDRALDVKLAYFLALFGLGGSFAGVWVVKKMSDMGQSDILISATYALVMTATAFSILIRSAFPAKKEAKHSAKKQEAIKLPWHVNFPVSEKSISMVVIILLGSFVGFLTGIMGIGGGFITVPIMTYILKLNPRTIVGTSLTQIFIITLFVTAMNIFQTNSLDLLLGTFLILGGIVGSFLGTVTAKVIKFEHINFLLALLILSVSLFFISQLTHTPTKTEMFVIESAPNKVE